VAFPDAYPLSEGHTLIIPRRHEPDFFALSTDEQHDMLQLARQVYETLLDSHHPAGFNVGVNVGEAGGQTVGHAHLHLIPRYEGDVDDPRGGIRWVIPSKAPYWEKSE
jgi:diadenosine tetraphosphate (Ap4A) HIT family hydrolase